MGFPALKKVSSVGLLANTVSPLGIVFGVGSLKVLAFAQRQLGSEAASDVTSKGVTVGFVIGRR